MNTFQINGSSLLTVLSVTLTILQPLCLAHLPSLFVQFVVLDFDLFVAVCAFASAAGSVVRVRRGLVEMVDIQAEEWDACDEGDRDQDLR